MTSSIIPSLSILNIQRRGGGGGLTSAQAISISRAISPKCNVGYAYFPRTALRERRQADSSLAGKIRERSNAVRDVLWKLWCCGEIEIAVTLLGHRTFPSYQ